NIYNDHYNTAALNITETDMFSDFGIVQVASRGKINSKTMTPQKITIDSNNRLVVPDNPIIPFIEGDGIGPDVWRASKRVIDAAVEHCYLGKRKIEWI